MFNAFELDPMIESIRLSIIDLNNLKKKLGK